MLRIRGAIARSPYIAEAFREASGIDDDLATLERQRTAGTEAGEHGMRRIADGADDEAGGQTDAIAELHSAGGDGTHAAFEDDFHAHLGEAGAGVVAEAGAEHAEQSLAAVHEGDAGLAGRDVFIKAAHTSDEILDLARGLDAGVATADDDEAEEVFALLRLREEIRLLHAADDGGAEFHGIAHIAHLKRVLGHAGDAAEIDARAGREHEVLKTHRELRRGAAAIERDDTRGEVDVRDLALQHLRATADHADGIHHMLRRKRSADDLRQHGLEDHVVLIRDDNDAQPRALRACEQLASTIHTRKPSADDGHVELSVWRFGHAVCMRAEGEPCGRKSAQFSVFSAQS